MPVNTEDAIAMHRLWVQSIAHYGIYMLTPQGTITSWNAGAERAKGYTAAEAIGSSFSMFYTAAEQAADVPAQNLSIAGATGHLETEGWRVRKDGQMFWAHIAIDAIRSESGELLGFAKITRDYTEQRRAQLAQQEEAMRFRLLVQGVTDYAIYMLDPQGHVVNWNAGAERAKGYKAAEIIGQNFAVFYSAEDRAAGVPQQALEVARREHRFEAEGWRLRKDGSRFWTSVVIDAILDDDGTVLGFAKVTRDITERRQHELALLQAKEAAEQSSRAMASLSHFLDSVIANIPACVLAQDTKTQKILLANQHAHSLFGDDKVSMVGHRPSDCLAPNMAAYLDQQIAHCLATQDLHLSESLVYTRIGLRNLRTRAVLSAPLDGHDAYVLVITEDVTDELAAYAKIQHMAQHDALTNLPNRSLLQERLQTALAASREDRTLTATMCLDMDNFKSINDALGHTFGDKILRALGQRLRRTLREQDTLARLGGDEFAVVLPGLNRLEEVELMAKRLIEAIEPIFQLDGHSFSIGVSIGVAIAPPDGSTAEEMLRFADMALYEAKHNGRNRYELFHPALEESARHRRQMEIDLRTALHLGQLQMFYQPIVEQATQQISGYEALMRWQHPTKGFVSPLEFIPIAEDTGLIHEVGARALNLACREATNWSNGAYVAVNLSPVQFQSHDLVQTITLALADSGLPPHRLELEITESVLLNNSEGNIQTLRTLKNLGISISLDDFGTGYSSLSYLRTFPFDRIKIDQSFVRDMGESREALAIIRAITGMSSSLLIKNTAEGVETSAQFSQLQDEGCSHFQGYLFGRPEPAHNRLQQVGKLEP